MQTCSRHWRCQCRCHNAFIRSILGQHGPSSAGLSQATVLTVQDHEGQNEPAPPPDTEMLTDDAAPNAHQSSAAAPDSLAEQGPQAQQPFAALSTNMQSNIFAAALAQAMAAMPQQQGEC